MGKVWETFGKHRKHKKRRVQDIPEEQSRRPSTRRYKSRREELRYSLDKYPQQKTNSLKTSRGRVLEFPPDNRAEERSGRELPTFARSRVSEISGRKKFSFRACVYVVVFQNLP